MKKIRNLIISTILIILISGISILVSFPSEVSATNATVIIVCEPAPAICATVGPVVLYGQPVIIPLSD